MELIDNLRDKVMGGQALSESEVYSLCDMTSGHSAELRAAARAITERFNSRNFDSCSIINARSGRCPENCKWCAQSAHYNTGCEDYPLLDTAHCVAAARHNRERGVKRFSMVCSGRAVGGKELESVCATLRAIRRETGIETCASLGLLDREGLQKLWDAGVRRYHCNLETAPSYFGKLVTTHTIDDKLKTIAMALEIGFEVCSGGIIGMGETMRQRAELALTLRKVRPSSIPLNVLCPIAGTPLGDTAPISEDEILDTLALFRFVHPGVQLRFAGGRARMSRSAQIEAVKIGMNGAITGDLLTTTGSTIADDRALVGEAGYEF